MLVLINLINEAYITVELLTIPCKYLSILLAQIITTISFNLVKVIGAVMKQLKQLQTKIALGKKRK